MTETELNAILDAKAKEYGFSDFDTWKNYEHWSFDKIDFFLLDLLHGMCRKDGTEPENSARIVNYMGKDYRISFTDHMSISPEPNNVGDKVSLINLAINQITEEEKSLSGKDRWVPQGRCYLVAFHKVPVESDLSNWTQTVISSYTGTKLYKDIQKQLEQKFSSPFVIDTISDLGPEVP